MDFSIEQLIQFIVTISAIVGAYYKQQNNINLLKQKQTELETNMNNYKSENDAKFEKTLNHFEAVIEKLSDTVQSLTIAVELLKNEIKHLQK